MNRHLDHLLALRLKVRGNVEATAFVDRALALLSQARNADEATAVALERDLDQLRDALALRFGAPRTAVVH